VFVVCQITIEQVEFVLDVNLGLSHILGRDPQRVEYSANIALKHTILT